MKFSAYFLNKNDYIDTFSSLHQCIVKVKLIRINVNNKSFQKSPCLGFQIQQQSTSRNKLWQKSKKFIEIQFLPSVQIIDYTFRFKVLKNKIVIVRLRLRIRRLIFIRSTFERDHLMWLCGWSIPYTWPPVNVWKIFETKNKKDYHAFYLNYDVLL